MHVPLFVYKMAQFYLTFIKRIFLTVRKTLTLLHSGYSHNIIKILLFLDDLVLARPRITNSCHAKHIFYGQKHLLQLNQIVFINGCQTSLLWSMTGWLIPPMHYTEYIKLVMSLLLLYSLRITSSCTTFRLYKIIL